VAVAGEAEEGLDCFCHCGLFVRFLGAFGYGVCGVPVVSLWELF
jgi:hypothetical protein